MPTCDVLSIKKAAASVDIKRSFEEELSRSPRLSAISGSDELREASYVMSRAFIFAKDPTWLRWLPSRALERLVNEDMAEAVDRVTRVIGYMLTVMTTSGGVVLAYRSEPTRRETVGRMLGAIMGKLPGAEKEDLADYIGAACALVSAFGAVAAIPSCLAYMRMVAATEAAARECQHPLNRSVYLGLVGVEPEFSGRGIGFSLFEPFFKVADRYGLATYLENSNASANTARFQKWNFGTIRDHVYAGPSLMQRSTLRRLGVADRFATPIMRRVPDCGH